MEDIFADERQLLEMDEYRFADRLVKAAEPVMVET